MELYANNIPDEINEIIKFGAKSLIAIIIDQNLEKEEIMSTLRLWAKSGWHKNA
jgi:hypothetical protein